MLLIISIFLILLYGVMILWFAEGISKSSQIFENGKHDPQPMVSVVISARNEENNIISVINALEQQTYPHYLIEILVADDRSRDSTAKILRQLSEININLKIVTIREIPIGWTSKKWALQSIIRESIGELILQTDADCHPEKTWVESVVSEFSDPSIGFVTGPAPLTGHRNYLDDIFEIDSLAQDAFSAGGMAHGLILSCTGRNMAFRKTVFDSVDGYSEIEHFHSGDDDLLLQKIAKETQWQIKFCVNPKCIVESPPPSSVIEFINQRLRFASKGMSYYKLETSNSLKLILPFLYLVNLFVVISSLSFIESASIGFLLPWLFKSIFDAILSYTFYARLQRKWKLSVFLPSSFFHPFYVTVFGVLGPFIPIRWKK